MIIFLDKTFLIMNEAIFNFSIISSAFFPPKGITNILAVFKSGDILTSVTVISFVDKFGIFASFTDVSSEEFGEGSFDKGIYFNIPIYGNFINYTWRPLTKDPGAKLIRKHTLHDLLVKFRPYN